MTEAEWLASGEPLGMLAFLRARECDRKLRRFCVEAVRPFSALFFHTDCHAALAVAEEVAEGRAGKRELVAAWGAAWEALAAPGGTPTELQLEAARAAAHVVESVPYTAVRNTVLGLFRLFSARKGTSVPVGDRLELWFPGVGVGSPYFVTLIRDIFGNPFRPVAFDPAWRTETAVGIARGIYDDRAFERLPILADELQEAGCEDAEVLAHCREPGTHVRGCWVVDLVLGKS